jgi:type IV pilus assembly protein PilY1
VPTTAKDTNAEQHMTTFTLGLGVDGQLAYDPSYESQQSGDYFNIKQGSLNWPKPAPDSATAVDDLWHAAVNGRGKYFSARDPAALSSGLDESLSEVAARLGAGAAAATSSLRPSAGDQLAFTAQFETVLWDGDLSARTIDVNTASSTFGQVSTASLWSAQALLDAKQWDSRKILMFDASDTGAGGDLLKSFCWTSGGTGCTNGAGMTAAEKTYFDVGCPTRSIILNQPWTGSCSSGGSGQVGAATGQKLVQYLRGDRSNEGTGVGTTDLFRPRTHILGDIVNAQPVYVKKPPFDYVDSNYTTFKANNANRQAVVFAAANDGMLHAFQVDPDGNPYFQTGGFATAATGDDTFTGTNDGGNEAWAFIPTAVLPQLHNLANSNPFGHLYYVDGSPVVGDVCDAVPCSAASNWHTILVGGLNHGGRGYYALDITDPLNPKGLWEFVVDPANPPACLTDAQAASGTFSTDCNLGYTYGQPVITKWKATASGNDGRWVVLVTSGYNNYNPGDGRGYLYMLDAITGKILGRVTTGVGSGGTSGAGFSDADPSGLAKINAWLENGLQNNTAEQVYGGDLKGNMWRFDIADVDPTKWKAVLITVAKAPDGTAQSITVRPELGKPRNQRAVFFGTGRYIGDTDPAITQIQTIYGIKDDLSGTAVDSLGGAVVTRSFAPQTTLADGTIARTISTSGTTLDFSSPTQSGFRIDLPGAGERVNVDPVLQVGTLVVASNFPETSSCTAGGSAWENYVDFETGFSVLAVGGVAGARKFSSGLIVGTTIVQLPGGKTVAITTSADTKQTTSSITGGGSGSGSLTGKRSAWRELMTE